MKRLKMDWTRITLTEIDEALGIVPPSRPMTAGRIPRLPNGQEFFSVSKSGSNAGNLMFWRNGALPFIEARLVRDGRKVCYARHWHETFSIGMISSGRCKYLNRAKTETIGAGTVVLMNPGDVHACNPIRDAPWVYRMLYIDVPWLHAIQVGHGANPDSSFTPFSETWTRQIDLYDGLNRLFETLFDPYVEHLGKETAAVSFLGLVQTRLSSVRSDQRERNPRLTRAAEFIRENCTRSLRLADICAEVDLSASYLIRAFKKVHGLTPHAYQINCRIEFSRSQLRTGRPIAEVALAAGFSDQAHLQRSFKSIVASTPGDYRA
jgi:AraC-like DNA-binding protein